MPVGMHDLATTESYKMYDHFKSLRTPTLGDQGPAFMLLQVASYRTMQQDADFLAALEKQTPDAPFPVFERAMREIETTPTDALKSFPEFIQRVKTGSIKLLPREAGYLPSAHYKLGFLQQQMGQIEEARDSFLRAKEISPTYAELNGNLAIVHAQLAEKETTGPRKLELFRKAVSYAAQQEKDDYRGKATLKASELRRKLNQAVRELQRSDEVTSAPAMAAH
jgi:tetratricopeptide (TPR) repeat protein